MISRPFTIVFLLSLALVGYVFIHAPAPLQGENRSGATFSIYQAMQIINAENHNVRSLWTKEIVGAGIKSGLKFMETWRDDDVEAGPLPALFLRDTARGLERSPVRLGLYLGSHYPISPSNKFEGVQLEYFMELLDSGKPQYFYADDTQRYTSMFADPASAKPCVVCHNEHLDSPRNNWRLDDIMGATTWSYPSSDVTLDDFMAMLMALRKSYQGVYAAYIEKTKTFNKKPEIGSRWPRDGYYIPSATVFFDEVDRLNSSNTLAAILMALRPQSDTTPPGEASVSGAGMDVGVADPR
ncbi:MAG: DUF3365 domain-containing protein [Granulosicoccus sp.]